VFSYSDTTLVVTIIIILTLPNNWPVTGITKPSISFSEVFLSTFFLQVDILLLFFFNPECILVFYQIDTFCEILLINEKLLTKFEIKICPITSKWNGDWSLKHNNMESRLVYAPLTQGSF
jgi:hypothetical protein